MQVAIDQLVFGYRDGHELLAGSLEIEPRLEADLLSHADARFEDDSEHYLVGYPVPSLQSFMLTRIWPAPELPRPGAVWAHSFLIDESALSAVDPLVLSQRFRRPTDGDLGSFTTRIQIEAGAKLSAEVPAELISALCDVAYESPEQPSVVIWPQGDTSEVGLMALWRNLPAADRSSFSFRSRGRARTGSSAYFLQVAAQLAGRSASQGVRIVNPADLTPSPPVALLAEASVEPSHPLNAPLNALTRSTADSLFIAGVWPLVRAEEAASVLDRLTGPGPKTVAIDLLSALFGSVKGDSWWKVSEKDRLLALFGVDSAAITSLLDEERLAGAWQGDRAAMLSLLDRRAQLPEAQAELLLTSALAHLAAGELLSRLGDPEILRRAIKSRSDLLVSPDFWVALEEVPDSDLRREAVIAAGAEALPLLLEAETWGLLDEALSDPELLARCFFLVAERSPADPALWNRVLSGREPQLLELLSSSSKVPDATSVLAAASIRQPLFNRVPARRWAGAATQIHDRDDVVAIVAAARLIAMTLRQKKPDRELLIECFGPAHRGLESGRITGRVKHDLDRVLPHAKTKSLSKRLSRALVENMESVDWSKAELRRALEPAGPEAQRMIKLVPKKHPARRLVEGALRDLEEMLPLP